MRDAIDMSGGTALVVAGRNDQVPVTETHDRDSSASPRRPIPPPNMPGRHGSDDAQNDHATQTCHSHWVECHHSSSPFHHLLDTPPPPTSASLSHTPNHPLLVINIPRGQVKHPVFLQLGHFMGWKDQVSSVGDHLPCCCLPVRQFHMHHHVSGHVHLPRCRLLHPTTTTHIPHGCLCFSFIHRVQRGWMGLAGCRFAVKQRVAGDGASGACFELDQPEGCILQSLSCPGSK